jgi:hypothetical protein
MVVLLFGMLQYGCPPEFHHDFVAARILLQCRLGLLRGSLDCDRIVDGMHDHLDLTPVLAVEDLDFASPLGGMTARILGHRYHIVFGDHRYSRALYQWVFLCGLYGLPAYRSGRSHDSGP